MNGQSVTSTPAIGPSALRLAKSMPQNRGTFASQKTVPPPTVVGRVLTSPTTRGLVSAALRRNVRGSTSGSARPNARRDFSSSFEYRVPGLAAVRSVKWLTPFSKTTTCQPAADNTIAAMPPPMPLPITAALPATGARPRRVEQPQQLGHRTIRPHRVGPVRLRHLPRGVAQRLPVPRPADVSPAAQPGVAAVLGH